MSPPPSDPPSLPSAVALSPAWRCLYIACGFFFVGLAVLGLLLPVLPTTPFLLLASWFFVRSSPRWNAWLLRSRWFGPFLRDWQRHRAVRLHVKVLALTLLALVVAFSLTFGNLPLPLLLLLSGLAAIGAVVILALPTLPAPGADAPSRQSDQLAPDPLQGQ